ncbi:MAG: hypothetical protein JRN56_05460 [Nitrososphaerota archaeon]|nr:ribbon-helix-helix domain-containing protein [Nitrososphaerota archaeon]MDG6957094.1 hypothetical protein [Nitrososphaerota archaeon]MDG6961837.1 hypothetical protein [Nitrososphaerota archaeon]MDG6970583.1 hypothetical protein [Nitrososphaerota archaeon]MDG6993185.1 hypothetical protein [Nitrososphaerota archaeon]
MSGLGAAGKSGRAPAKKVRTGISFDPDIADALDRRSRTFKELGVSRSEVVNAILMAFLEADGSNEAVWDAVTKRRIRRRGRRQDDAVGA